MDPLAKNELWFALVIVVLIAAYCVLYAFTFARVSSPCAACEAELAGHLQKTRSCKLSQLSFGGKPIEPFRDVDVELWSDPNCPEKGFAARLQSRAFLTPLTNTRRFVATLAPHHCFSDAGFLLDGAVLQS